MKAPGNIDRETNNNGNKALSFSQLLTEDLLYRVNKPGQYLGNEWGAVRADFDSAEVRLCLAFPDVYELGMSNFGQRILYQLVNAHPSFLADRTYAPASDLEEILRHNKLPLWGFECRRQLKDYELIGFSLQYELTYTNLLNMLEMSDIPVDANQRESVFPLIFAGGPSTVNPEPMARFCDFFIVGDGEEAVPKVMEVVQRFKAKHGLATAAGSSALRRELLLELASEVSGVYVPCLYEMQNGPVAKPAVQGIPESVPRQIMPLNDGNLPTAGIVPYLAPVHDRQVLEVRRGCDRGCRFCQPGYTFLPVRERSTDDLVRLSKEALDQSGYQEYSLLSLCVSDYTSLHETVRALNQEHASRRASMSFPSQRADRMNFDIAEELKAVRKSGITLAPEAGTERLRAVINKGLSHQQIIDAITTAYQSGWSAVKLYYMIGLPTERDEDLQGIIDTLKEASAKCREIRKSDPVKFKAPIEFTCTISNFVPKPFTPFQWFGQCRPAEFLRKHEVLRDMLRASGLKGVQLNFTSADTSLLEAVISRGDRVIGDLIFAAWRKGCTFDAWEERLKMDSWREAALELGLNLDELGCADREVGSPQPWDVVNVGLANWWLVNEWKKALAVKETAPCSENTCHACGICTDLSTNHELANPKEIVLGKNPFVKPIKVEPKPEPHPSLEMREPPAALPQVVVQRLVFEFKKTGELRFIGHLDLQHLFIRAARRANVNVAYSEGFNPAPKLSLALSLALYLEGLAEVAEIELSEKIDAEDFVRRMNAQLPSDVQIVRAKLVEKSNIALAQLVGRATYRATLAPQSKVDSQGMKEMVSAVLAAECLEVEITPNAKKKKPQFRRKGAPHRDDRKEEISKRDIKPGIYSLTVTDHVTVEMELAHGPKLHVKPADVLKFVSADAEWRLTRVALTNDDGTPLFDHWAAQRHT